MREANDLAKSRDLVFVCATTNGFRHYQRKPTVPFSTANLSPAPLASTRDAPTQQAKP
jgi:hypothetical protein